MPIICFNCKKVGYIVAKNPNEMTKSEKYPETSTKEEEMNTKNGTKINVQNPPIFLRKILMMNLMNVLSLMNLMKLISLRNFK